jgi:hypothetical protein
MTADMQISIETMPWFSMSDFGKCLAVSSFKQRIVAGWSMLPGYVTISSALHPGVLNGEDYTVREIGDGRYNAVTAIKKFYNEVLVYQEEKGTDGGCLTLIEGYSPATYGNRIIDTKHGTFSSKSVVVVNDVPVQSSLSVSQEGTITSAPSNITAAFSISRDGIYMCNGKALQEITGDVKIYFDPKNANCIRKGYEREHSISYDSAYQVIKVDLVTGVSATVPNTHLIYDIYTRKWAKDTVAQDMSCHCEVEADSGQFPLLQVSGGTDDGTLYLQNTGLDDNGTAITASFTMEFDGRGHDLAIEEMVLRVSGACTLTPYADGVAQTAITVSS